MIVDIVCGALVLYGAFMTLCAIGKITMPFTVDRVWHIYACPDAATRTGMVAMFRELRLRAAFQIDSGGIERDLLDDGTTVINNASPELYEAMGRPAAAIAVVVKDPVAIADWAVSYLLETHGMTAQVLGELDKSAPAGAMVFIHVDNVPWLLVLRVHKTKMGKRPERYHRAA